MDNFNKKTWDGPPHGICIVINRQNNDAMIASGKGDLAEIIENMLIENPDWRNHSVSVMACKDSECEELYKKIRPQIETHSH